MNPKDKHADWLLKPTANELADAMEIRASIRRKATSRKSVTEGANDRLADQLERAATMLRQQQADLKDADKYAFELERLYEDAKAEIEALKAGKIRAYDNGVEDGRKPNTHLVKELTDEEIIEIGLLTTDPRFSHIESPLLLEFARAILRKAQEK